MNKKLIIDYNSKLITYILFILILIGNGNLSKVALDSINEEINNNLKIWFKLLKGKYNYLKNLKKNIYNTLYFILFKILLHFLRS